MDIDRLQFSLFVVKYIIKDYNISYPMQIRYYDRWKLAYAI